jgi:pimeloyl-ACP methyl ester carboxylesterase
MANRPDLRTLTTKDGESIAYRSREGKASAKSTKAGNPGLFSLTGLMSEMDGNKAIETDRFAKARGLSAVRFDYFGHGASSGAFEAGTISRWLADTCQVFDDVTRGPQIVVGSSLGGWLALLLALARPERVKGLVLIAPSPDFTKGMLETLPAEAKALFDEGKPWPRPSEYGDEPYLISKELLEDGANHLLLGGPIDIPQPVRILHGMNDRDVPWERSLDLVDKLGGSDVSLKLIKSGDHRLSDEAGLRALSDALREILDL